MLGWAVMLWVITLHARECLCLENVAALIGAGTSDNIVDFVRKRENVLMSSNLRVEP